MGVEEMITQQAEEKGILKGMEKGIQKGSEKGIEKGTLQNKIQIAQKMILKELSDSFIC